MYAIEGELVTQKHPEAYLGKTGIYSESLEYRPGGAFVEAVRITGHEKAVNFVANRMRRAGRIPVDATAERITSIEQAEKYVQPSTSRLRIVRFREPDLERLLGQQVPEDEELLNGSAQMWSERRIPTPYVYFAAFGRLLADVEFDPSTGWRDRVSPPGHMDDSRIVMGLLTPVVNLSVTAHRS